MSPGLSCSADCALKTSLYCTPGVIRPLGPRYLLIIRLPPHAKPPCEICGLGVTHVRFPTAFPLAPTTGSLSDDTHRRRGIFMSTQKRLLVTLGTSMALAATTTGVAQETATT